MADSLAAVVLAAGAGVRMAPLTRVRAKPLCPVDGVALVDLAIERVAPFAARLAVNLHYRAAEMEEHLDGRVHVSHEVEEPLGTAGAIGRLAPWLGDADVVVVNGDTWCPGDLQPLAASWDRARVRVVVSGPEGPATLGPRSRVVASMMPNAVARSMPSAPAGLYEVCWRGLAERGGLDVVGWEGPLFDCGTPADYLAANMAASGGQSVVAPDADILGRLERSVVWSGAHVAAGEHLVDAIRVSDQMTVLVR